MESAGKKFAAVAAAGTLVDCAAAGVERRSVARWTNGHGCRCGTLGGCPLGRGSGQWRSCIVDRGGTQMIDLVVAESSFGAGMKSY